MDLSTLPASVLALICSLLTGSDAFYLSYSSRWWLQHFSDESSWQDRLGGSFRPPSKTKSDISWKLRYYQSRSLLFKSASIRPQWQGEAASDRSFASLFLYDHPKCPYPFDLCTWQNKSFSFDSRFFMLPGSEEQLSGGVLYGGQSDRPMNDKSPLYFQPFVMVDSKFNLKCSILNELEIVAQKLTLKRWYHLALTYDWERRRQTVYLDGVNVSTKEGGVHRHWRLLSQQQVGCGYIRSHGEYPRRDPFGWYTFHGVVDAFRVWEEVLAAEAVEKLVRGGDLTGREYLEQGLHLQATIDRTQDGGAEWVNVQRVRCSRPAESKHAHIDEVTLEH